MTIVAVIGAKALYLLFAWLASAIIASWLSNRKGYGEKPGLATGLLLSVVGIVVWLVYPAKDDSRWKHEGALPKRRPRPAA
jgi:hypothetical protein